MNPYRLIVGCWLIVIFYASTAAAYDMQKGIHGMNWGSSIEQYGELSKVAESGPASFYANSGMSYHTANQPVPAVYYGFYRDRLFAVFIKLRSPDQFAHLERQLSAKHGQPKTVENVPAGQIVYRWQDADVKIKLKMKGSSSEYKLAIYYAPLAAKLNEEQLEEVPDNVSESTPLEKDKRVKSAPLLDY